MLTLHFDNTEIAFAHVSTFALRRRYALLAILRRPWLAKASQALGHAGLACRIPGVAWAIQRMVFDVFCGGTTLDDLKATSAKLAQSGVGTIVDYAAESQPTENARDHAWEQLRACIHAAATWKHGHVAVAVKASAIQDVQLLERMQAGDIFNADDAAIYQRGCERLSTLAALAAQHHVTLMVDAEESWFQKSVDDQVRALMIQHNTHNPWILMTIQAYLRGADDVFETSLNHAQQHGYTLGIKLVRGAYLEKERQRAQQLKYDDPTQPSKQHSDAAFDRIAARGIASQHPVALCLATHNETSTRDAAMLCEKYHAKVWFAQLYGMVDHLTYGLARAGMQVSKYVPYGTVRDAFPYLTRRAEENRTVMESTEHHMHLIAQELKRRSKIDSSSLRSSMSRT